MSKNKGINKADYAFNIRGNKVIAISSYAGKIVQAEAKCSPEDTFDVNRGVELASARCNMKIAEKRLKKAHKDYYSLRNQYNEIFKKLCDKEDFLETAKLTYEDAHEWLIDVDEREARRASAENKGV